MPNATLLWHVNTEFFKDRLAYAIAGDESGDRRLRWWTHKDPGAEYARQMTSEHKVLERSSRGAVTSRWVRKPGHRANHWWDCEVLAMVAAHMLGVHNRALREQVGPERQREMRRRQRIRLSELQGRRVG